jgi:hypothetical protein
MGYVNDVSLVHFISPFRCGYSAGTWAADYDTEVIKNIRTAADAEFDVVIPIELPGSEAVNQGAKITSIDIWYTIATAAADNFTGPVMSKMTLAATGVAVSGAAVTVTMDTGHDSAAECKATGSHMMTVTPSAEFYLEDDYAYYIKFTVDAAATTVFSLIGAQINYELRL